MFTVIPVSGIDLALAPLHPTSCSRRHCPASLPEGWIRVSSLKSWMWCFLRRGESFALVPVVTSRLMQEHLLGCRPLLPPPARWAFLSSSLRTWPEPGLIALRTNQIPLLSHGALQSPLDGNRIHSANTFFKRIGRACCTWRKPWITRKDIPAQQSHPAWRDYRSSPVPKCWNFVINFLHPAQTSWFPRVQLSVSLVAL